MEKARVRPGEEHGTGKHSPLPAAGRGLAVPAGKGAVQLVTKEHDKEIQ